MNEMKERKDKVENEDRRDVLPCSVSVGLSTTIESLLEAISFYCSRMQKHFALLMLPQWQLLASLLEIQLRG
jgi:hypothetical protein